MNLLQFFCSDDDARESLNLGKTLKDMNERLKKMASTLDQIIDKVSQQSTQLDSLNSFVEGLQQQIKELKLNPQDQAKIDALFAKVSDNDQRIADAFAENSPPAPVPPVQPV